MGIPTKQLETWSKLGAVQSSKNTHESMNIHEGTGTLEINCNGTILSGYYYSGRGRQNIGDITLTLIPTQKEDHS